MRNIITVFAFTAIILAACESKKEGKECDVKQEQTDVATDGTVATDATPEADATPTEDVAPEDVAVAEDTASNEDTTPVEDVTSTENKDVLEDSFVALPDAATQD